MLKLTFKRPVVFSCVLLVVVIIGVIPRYFHCGPDDVIAYNKLKESSEPTAALMNQAYTCKQYRELVNKTIFVSSPKERKGFRLESLKSELTFSQVSMKDVELKEEMQEVACLMQEELYYIIDEGQIATRHPNGRLMIKDSNKRQSGPSWIDEAAAQVKPMQNLRRIDADTATFNYKDNLFIANDVLLSRYIADSHHLDPDLSREETSMVGEAESISLSVTKTPVQFKAEKLKAVFQGNGGSF
jgi:hypothetical protein